MPFWCTWRRVGKTPPWTSTRPTTCTCWSSSLPYGLQEGSEEGYLPICTLSKGPSMMPPHTLGGREFVLSWSLQCVLLAREEFLGWLSCVNQVLNSLLVMTTSQLDNFPIWGHIPILKSWTPQLTFKKTRGSFPQYHLFHPSCRIWPNVLYCYSGSNSTCSIPTRVPHSMQLFSFWDCFHSIFRSFLGSPSSSPPSP